MISIVNIEEARGIGDQLLFVHNHDHLITPLQFTGLKDKNGKEIYEGDIVRRDNKQWIVEWDKYNTGFLPFIYHGDQIANDEIEVIENIYENPDLIN